MQTRTRMMLFPISAALMLALCTRPWADPPASPKEEPVPAEAKSRPPIDAAAPAKFETATFSLG